MSERKQVRFRDCLTRREFALIIGIGMATAASSLALLLLLRELFREVQALAYGAPFAEIYAPIGAFAAIALVNAIMRGLEFAIPEAISLQSIHRLRLRAYRHMTGMAPSQIQHRSRGSLILRLTGDLTMLRVWLSRGLAQSIVSSLVITATLMFIASFSPFMALEVLLVFLLGTGVSLMLGWRLQRLTRTVRKRRSLLTSNIDEQVNALATVQTFGRVKGEIARLGDQSQSMTRALVRETLARGILRTIASATSWLAMGMVIIVGAIEVQSGRLDLAAVLAALLGVRMLQGYFRKLGQAQEYWRRSQVSRIKLEDFLNSSSRELADPSHGKLMANRAAIVFEDVSIENSLRGFSATIPAGRHIAIVGPNGSGKSSILRAVAQLSEVTSGRITIGGEDIAERQISSVQQKLGLVSPDLPLMRGTVRRNLLYRKPSASQQELDALIEFCGLEDAISGLEQGYDTWLTEGAANISHGLRQQLMCARAMLGFPPTLMFDNAGMMLDPDNAAWLRYTLSHYAGTILNVTHDPLDIEIADQVWEVRDGRLAGTYTPSEYIARQRGQINHLRVA